ncbi:hypothetical protein Pint_18350 [Pistacia integerrima]|uniref:Uncharacterized protein n=1 Tax=Pistacia integerrima TaxID=434235 RepID=A0ACC0Z192_9ROSI|nr:hypothetical protein Pint_18350 [Pistacia integerrima]
MCTMPKTGCKYFSDEMQNYDANSAVIDSDTLIDLVFSIFEFQQHYGFLWVNDLFGSLLSLSCCTSCREEAKQIKSQSERKGIVPASEDIPDHIKRKTAASYRELEGRRSRVQELEKLYMDMALQKELQKKGRKRKLREEEIVSPTSRPVYKWRSERKR